MDFKKKENLIDVSSFFLFEASGDSEAAGCFDPGLRVVSRSDDDDDAESCCSDVCDFSMVSKMCGSYRGGEVLGRGFGEDEEEDEDGEAVEQEPGRLHEDKRWRGDKIQSGKPTNISVDHSKKIMKEREKCRVFWETCLAS